MKKYELLEIYISYFVREQVLKELFVELIVLKIFVMMNKVIVDKFILLFRNVYCIVKLGRLYIDYVIFCLIDQVKGLKIGNIYIIDKQNFDCQIR